MLVLLVFLLLLLVLLVFDMFRRGGVSFAVLPLLLRSRTVLLLIGVVSLFGLLVVLLLLFVLPALYVLHGSVIALRSTRVLRCFVFSGLRLGVAPSGRISLALTRCLGSG